MRFRIDVSPLDLGLTLGCGQTFRWREMAEGVWTGPLERHLIRLWTHAGRLQVEAEPGGPEVRGMVAEYLRTEDDIRSIHRALGDDPVLARGIRRYRGLRIVKMDEWECLISYALATYANIPRIRKMIETLSSSYGERIADGVNSFPKLRRLRQASVRELERCGLGYRAGYIHQLCASVSEGDLRRLKALPYQELRQELIALPGVGDKVADCVSLFGFGRLEAFPIDVWVERSLARLYNIRGSYRKLRAFASERFGPYAGYAQEYLYHNERAMALGDSCAFSEE